MADIYGVDSVRRLDIKVLEEKILQSRYPFSDFQDNPVDADVFVFVGYAFFISGRLKRRGRPVIVICGLNIVAVSVEYGQEFICLFGFHFNDDGAGQLSDREFLALSAHFLHQSYFAFPVIRRLRHFV